MIKWINKKRNQKGFTLIELIVVVAILGILAAIAIPRFLSSREKAEQSSVVANLRTIESAIMVYIAEGVEDKLAEDGVTLVDAGYLAGWPTGPKEAVYTITGDGGVDSPYRAIVNGTVGGVQLDDAKVEDALAEYEKHNKGESESGG